MSANRYLTGTKAERRAAWYLRLRGYRILACRYKTKVGEVDLIARRGGVLAFVEVKARTTEQAALEAVSLRSQQRIRRTAEHFIGQQALRIGRAQTLRFDVVAIVPRSLKGLPPKVTYLKNAF